MTAGGRCLVDSLGGGRYSWLTAGCEIYFGTAGGRYTWLTAGWEIYLVTAGGEVYLVDS